MRLFHFTNEEAWEAIEREGEIISGVEVLTRQGQTDSLAEDEWERRLDNLVWVSANGDARAQAWTGCQTAKRVRITLEASFPRWLEYAADHGFPASWIPAPETERAFEWHVSEASIPRSQWVSAVNVTTKNMLWTPSNA